MALPDETGVEITELLLKSGADPNIRDCAFGAEENGRTPAHIASSREDNDQVQCTTACMASPDTMLWCCPGLTSTNFNQPPTRGDIEK